MEQTEQCRWGEVWGGFYELGGPAWKEAGAAGGCRDPPLPHCAPGGD